MNDDIEILDIFNDNKKNDDKKVESTKKESKPNKIEHEPVKKIIPKVPKRKSKVKTKAIQVLFCSISALFILGCCVFYGLRLIKYYKIYNPKIENENGNTLLAKDISNNSEIVYEGDGLYISSGNYIYKGNVNNNNLKFNNMLWRILRVNVDNSIDIILDDYINLLPWNKSTTEFSESEIYKYLNEDFLNQINKEMLIKTNYCADLVDDLGNITCEKHDTDTYVMLLDITSFLNTVKDKKSFLVQDDEIMWLNNYSTDKVWHTNGVNVSKSDSTTFYEIRPVVKLKNNIYYTSGDGSKENPYVVEDKEELSLGSVVKLGQDNWIVYDMSNNIRLMREDVLEAKHNFDNTKNIYDVDSKDSLANYLNTTYLDSLSYKDMLIEDTFYVGAYKDSIRDVEKNTVKVKVGIPNIIDHKLNSSVKSYFTSTANEDIIWVYENPLRPSRNTSTRSIRPCIVLDKSYINKLKFNKGYFEVA